PSWLRSRMCRFDRFQGRWRVLGRGPKQAWRAIRKNSIMYPLLTHFITMSEEPEKNPKIELAIALARGVSVWHWARVNSVAKNTAYRWSREPEVRKEVANIRRRLVSQALGRLTRNASKAADTIVRTLERGDSDAVRLRAARAVLSDIITVSKFSDL